MLSADEDMANTDTNEWYASPQLAVSNARYAQYRVWLTSGNPSDVQRVGLSATQNPLEEVGRFMVGPQRTARPKVSTRGGGS